MQISTYHNSFKEDFKTLNIAWLETYFYVEPYDLEVLSKPEEYIINKGGHIFFALDKNKAVATVALMPTNEPAVLELTKMAVHTSQRGLGIGQRLMEHCIAFAKANNIPKLILYSNTILENAIHIYRKYGFKEILVEANASYKRANIKMELKLH